MHLEKTKDLGAGHTLCSTRRRRRELNSGRRRRRGRVHDRSGGWHDFVSGQGKRGSCLLSNTALCLGMQEVGLDNATLIVIGKPLGKAGETTATVSSGREGVVAKTTNTGHGYFTKRKVNYSSS
jgi:hypothetical protein